MINYEELKKSKYGIKKKKGKFYVNDEELDEKSFLVRLGYVEDLTKKTKESALKYLGNITSVPGIYAIFKKDTNGELGKCLYIGQSFNIKHRCKEHIDNLYNAYGTEFKVLTMYKDLNNIGKDNIKFVRLFAISNKYWDKMDYEEKNLTLTILEDYFISSLKPKLNVIQARRTDEEVGN